MIIIAYLLKAMKIYLYLIFNVILFVFSSIKHKNIEILYVFFCLYDSFELKFF